MRAHVHTHLYGIVYSAFWMDEKYDINLFDKLMLMVYILVISVLGPTVVKQPCVRAGLCECQILVGLSHQANE